MDDVTKLIPEARSLTPDTRKVGCDDCGEKFFAMGEVMARMWLDHHRCAIRSIPGVEIRRFENPATPA